MIVLLSGGGGKNSLEWICAGGGEQKQCRVDIMQVWICMVIFYLCIHKYNIIDGIA